MKTGRETGKKSTPKLSFRLFASAVMSTHTEFRTCVKSVKIRRKSLAYREVVLQTGPVIARRLRRGNLKTGPAAGRLLRFARNDGKEQAAKIRRNPLARRGVILQAKYGDMYSLRVPIFKAKNYNVFAIPGPVLRVILSTNEIVIYIFREEVL